VLPVEVVSMKILFVVGARPNFMKVAPLMIAAERWNLRPRLNVRFEQVLVHTGQHYYGLPEPDEYLGVGSGSHARQTARLLEALEPVVCRHRPDAVVVPGDVNSTCAGALVAAKLNVPVVHLEAGLRSGDRDMPEEINRIVADHLSDLLLTTCADGDDNLLREGIAPDRIVDVGNTMIDSLKRLRPRAEATIAMTRARLAVHEGPLVLATLHRPSNVDEPEMLLRLLGVLGEASEVTPVVFPMHLRTRDRLADLDADALVAHPRLHLIEPLGYLEFLGLMIVASAVITDSGGVQEETSTLGVPCVTVRTSTERPVTIARGTNRLVDPHDPPAILAALMGAIQEGPTVPPPTLPLWDGHAGERAIEAVARWAVAPRARCGD